MNEVTPLACKSEMLRLMSKTFVFRNLIGMKREFNLSDLGWSFELNNHFNANGQCRHNSMNSTKILMLSEWLINNIDRTMEIWKDIMLHEIAHAIDIEMRGHTDHSDVWVKVAHNIGCSGEIGTPGDFKQGVHPLFIIECPTCGNQEITNGLTDYVKEQQASCGICNPHYFDVNHVLTWRPNPDHIYDNSIESTLYLFGRTE